MSTHTTNYPLGPRAKLVIRFDYDKGHSGCHTQRNGDPGWPEEPASVEVTDVQVWTRPADTGPFVNIGVSLPDEVTDSEWLEARCWAEIEKERQP